MISVRFPNGERGASTEEEVDGHGESERYGGQIYGRSAMSRRLAVLGALLTISGILVTSTEAGGYQSLHTRAS